jgi:hypothetical protein
MSLGKLKIMLHKMEKKECFQFYSLSVQNMLLPKSALKAYPWDLSSKTSRGKKESMGKRKRDKERERE